QAVARLDVGRRGGNNLVADVQALGSEDISLFTILVLDERDVRGAVRVVLERHNGCRHIQLLALEVDDTVLFLVAAADVTDGDAAVAVAAGGLLDLFEKALLGLHLGQALVGQHSHISARGRRRVESLNSHLEFQLLDSLLSGWLPHKSLAASIETTVSIEYSADLRAPFGALDSGLHKNRDTCSRFLWICAANPIKPRFAGVIQAGLRLTWIPLPAPWRRGRLC